MFQVPLKVPAYTHVRLVKDFIYNGEVENPLQEEYYLSMRAN